MDKTIDLNIYYSTLETASKLNCKTSYLYNLSWKKIFVYDFIDESVNPKVAYYLRDRVDELIKHLNGRQVTRTIIRQFNEIYNKGEEVPNTDVAVVGADVSNTDVAVAGDGTQDNLPNSESKNISTSSAEYAAAMTSSTDKGKKPSLAQLINANCDIRIVANKYLQPAANNTYVCECGSGSNNHHNTGLSYDARRNKLHCFVCNISYSVTDLICKYENLQTSGKDFVKALKIACDIYGINFDNPNFNGIAPELYQQVQSARDNQEKPRYQFEKLDEARSNLKSFFDAQGGAFRGIPYADYAKAKAGYLPDHYFISVKGKHPAIIFEADNGDIFARAVDVDAKDNTKDFPASTITLKVPTADVTNKTYLIVEGVFDALSILFATNWTANIICCRGTSNLEQLKQTLNRLFPADKPNFILMLDNDEKPDGRNPGQAAAQNFISALRSEGYCVVNRVLTDEKNVDANKFLLAYGKEKLKATIEEILQDAQIELAQEREKLLRRQEEVPRSDKNQSADLQEQLKQIKAQLADFDAKKDAAIEFLKGIETFDSATVFADNVIKAGAFALLYDRQVYSEFCRALKNYGDKNVSDKVNANDWRATVKDEMQEVAFERKKIIAQLKKVQSAIATKKFFTTVPDFEKISRPDDYSITLENGVIKIDGEKEIVACRRPVIIAGKTKSVINETKFKIILQYCDTSGKWHTLPARPAATVFNRNKIIDLSDDGLPVSSFNSNFLVDYLDAFNAINDSKIPITCTVPRCGWYNFNDEDVFVDPRRSCTYSEGENIYPLVVDSSSQFAAALTTKGTLDQWKKAYDIAKTSPVARIMVAAAVAPPLLKILDDARNILLYVKAHTRAGKTSTLNLCASAIGEKKVIRSFDATKNGLLAAAADVNDYAFLLDEKQSADGRMKEQLSLLVYALSNGIGRTRLNSNSTLKKTDDWRTVAIMTGETDLLEDNATGGAFTRALTINAPKTILSTDACKEIRNIIKDNYGLVIPLVIDKIFEYGKKELLSYYEEFINDFAQNAPEIPQQYHCYLAVFAVADFLLNVCLGVDEEAAYNAANKAAIEIFKFIPTVTEIDDTQREIDFVEGFIAQNQSCFIGGNLIEEKMRDFYGKIENDCVYITVAALKLACKESGFNYSKVVDDLLAANVFVPSEKIPKGCKSPLKTHQKKWNGLKTNCYKFVSKGDDSGE